jgi:ferredoxin-like protein FixX
VTTGILSKNEWKSEAESYDFVGFAFLGETESRREVIPVLYVPAGFRPEDYLRVELRRYADHARYLLHLIHVRSIFDKRTKNGWVTLKAGYLRLFLPWRKYKSILEDLEAAGVIEVKRDRVGRAEWRTGRRSKLYRFGPAFRRVTVHRFEPQNHTLRRKLIEWRDDEHDRTSSCPVRCYLREQLKRVRVDYQGAVACLGSLGLSADAETHCKNALVHLQDRDWRFTTDSYGRVHHNISSLKRELRQFLTVDGEELAEVDISNSQPLFLGLTYLNWLKNGQSLFSINDPEGYFDLHQFKIENIELLLSASSSPSFPNKVHNQSQFIPYHNTIPLRCDFCHILNKNIEGTEEENRLSISKDAVEYLRLCEQGRLYEFLAEQAGEDVSTNRTRGEFKQRCFRDVFYAKKGYRTALQDLFRRLFPSIKEFIDEVKYKDREHLACWMQRVESSFVINRVVKRFKEEKPGAFVLTIHDSVMAKVTDIDTALKWFREEFHAVGLHPRLDRK